jgi:hypothetical protein
MTSPPSRPEPSSGNDTAAAGRRPRVAIVIVNYKGRDDTLECLRSLSRLSYPAWDVFLVHQPPDDGTADAVRASFGWVRQIENRENNGFAGGNNVGIRAALALGADYLFLLNNDTVVEPGLLEPLVALAEGDPRIGVVGPKMLYHDPSNVVWSAGGGVDWRGRATRWGDGEPDRPGGEPRDVDYIVGCGLLVKREVLERVGLLDERYFLYFEETALCARVREAGYRVVYQPAARLWHKVSRSTGAESDLTLYYMRRNVLLYLGEHGARPFLGRLAALTDDLRLAAVWTLRGEHRRRRVLLRAVADYARGRFGKSRSAFT